MILPETGIKIKKKFFDSFLFLTKQCDMYV